MGIAVHTATTTGVKRQSADLAAGVRQDATGLFGTTVLLSDMASDVTLSKSLIFTMLFQVIPFVAGGFLYIGAVAVLPTYVFDEPAYLSHLLTVYYLFTPNPVLIGLSTGVLNHLCRLVSWRRVEAPNRLSVK